MSGLAALVGVVQFLFTMTWTAYVVYLPALAKEAGIAAWVPWLLVADQLIFAAMDVVTGYWVDRVRAALGRLGGWIVAVSAISCLGFVMLPYARASSALLLAAIALWAVTSSALRSPPWALLARHAPSPAIPWLATLVLTGTAIASALAPYLGVALRGADPRVPFIASTVVLFATVVVLVFAERRLGAPGAVEPRPPATLPGGTLFVALLILALGFQLHFALNAAPRYAQFAARDKLPYLLPLFWVGFNLCMFPAERLVRRWGAADVMAIAAALGALAVLAAALAPNLALLALAEFIAGGSWGAASVAAYTAAVSLGRGGREGRYLGTLFAMLALAVALRLAATGSGLAQTSAFLVLAPWLPQSLWLCAALLLLAPWKRKSLRS
ncbi:MAG TPA: MFS transporter [Burkholderiales bacterium]|nr:MFS transporter [Burkholderiales bacterium]